MKNKEQIISEIENCELMISIEHLKDYNLIKKHWLEWVLKDEK